MYLYLHLKFNIKKFKISMGVYLSELEKSEGETDSN